MPQRTKNEIIDIVTREYMEQVALKANHAPRGQFLSYDNTEFTEYAKRKFTKDELTVIWQNYVLSNPPKKAAERIQHRSAPDLIRLFVSENNVSNYLVEHKVDDSYCDLVVFQDDTDFRTAAVEIKSNGDDLRKAVDQCERYAQWANAVFVLVETEKQEQAVEGLPSWVGVKVVESDEITMVREADDLNQSLLDLVELMTVDQLKELLRTIGTKVSGRKHELLDRVKANINEIPEPTARRTLLLG